MSSQIPFSQQMQSAVQGIASMIDKAPTQPTTIQMIETRSQPLYPNGIIGKCVFDVFQSSKNK